MKIWRVNLTHKMTNNYSDHLQSSWNWIKSWSMLVLVDVCRNSGGIVHILSADDENSAMTSFCVIVSRYKLVSITKKFPTLGLFMTFCFSFYAILVVHIPNLNFLQIFCSSKSNAPGLSMKHCLLFWRSGSTSTCKK